MKLRRDLYVLLRRWGEIPKGSPVNATSPECGTRLLATQSALHGIFCNKLQNYSTHLHPIAEAAACWKACRSRTEISLARETPIRGFRPANEMGFRGSVPRSSAPRRFFHHSQRKATAQAANDVMAREHGPIGGGPRHNGVATSVFSHRADLASPLFILSNYGAARRLLRSQSMSPRAAPRSCPQADCEAKPSLTLRSPNTNKRSFPSFRDVQEEAKLQAAVSASVFGSPETGRTDLIRFPGRD